MDITSSLSARLQHEARTPLNAILGMVELLEGTPLDNDQRSYVTVLRRATEALMALVAGLPENPEAQIEAQGKGPEAGALNGMRILLVDDAEDNRFLIIRYLRYSGALIDEARDGAEALMKIKNASYDVVLMDLEMPVMDGLAASRAIRELEGDRQRQRTRIIALTARDPREALEESRAAGCDELITKPVRKATVVEALAKRSEVADLVPGYLAKRRAEIPVLREALARGDFGSIGDIAHKLSGTGAGYGLPNISSIGAAMERAAKAAEPTTSSTLIDALANAIAPGVDQPLFRVKDLDKH